MIKNQGNKYNYKTELIDRRIAKPNHKIISSLNLDEDEDVVFLKRLRYLEKEPIIIVDSYLSLKKYKKLLEIPLNVFHEDLYSLMDELFGVKVYKSEREVAATRMTLEDASLLNMEIWEPCLRLSAISYDKNLEPFEYFDSRFKGDTCSLKTSLVRKRQ